eukprot:4522938-Prymnesium_polylepis.1
MIFSTSALVPSKSVLACSLSWEGRHISQNISREILVCPAPHRTAPHCTAPCRAAPHRAAPCRTVPCRTVPCRAVPCRAVPC